MIDSLRCFVAAVDFGSLSKAAVQLDMTVSIRRIIISLAVDSAQILQKTSFHTTCAHGGP